MSKSLRNIAYHEAGHAVAACFVGKRFTAVTIVPSEKTLGACDTTPWSNFHPDVETASRLNYDARAVGSYAGGRKFASLLS